MIKQACKTIDNESTERALDILFIDKNNTPDKWKTTSDFLREIAAENNAL